MPKTNRLWTCDVCGQVLPNEPKPVLTHVMSHAARRPFATSAALTDLSRARQATVKNLTVEKRTGRDGSVWRRPDVIYLNACGDRHL
jgi:hypothetical protein